MSTLTTKVTITAATVVAGFAAAAAPARAGDGVVATSAASQQALADAIHLGATVVAVLAGVVLLSKALHGYRRSQWRRQWIERSTVLYVGSPHLAGSISGRSPRPATGLSSFASPVATGSVSRSGTRL